MIYTKIRDVSVNIEQEMINKFSSRYSEALSCSDQIFENKNYSDEEDQKKLLNFIFIAKCERARLFRSDFLNLKMKMAEASEIDQEFINDVMGFYDMSNFDLVKDEEETTVSQVLRKMMEKTYSEKQAIFEQLLKEQAEAEEKEKEGEGLESVKRRKKISKRAKQFKEPFFELKKLEEHENQLALNKSFQKVTESLLNLSFTCFFSGGYKLAYNILKRLYVVRGPAGDLSE